MCEKFQISAFSSLQALLQAHHLLEERHIAQCICEICDLTPDDDLLTEMLAKTGGFAKSLNLEISPQCRPVLLVLDRVGWTL